MPKNYCIMQIWAESGKPALPICNYSQILYQFLTFTQNLKRSRLWLSVYLGSIFLVAAIHLLSVGVRLLVHLVFIWYVSTYVRHFTIVKSTSSLWPHRSQKRWYLRSIVILHRGHRGNSAPCLYEHTAFTCIGHR